MNKSNNPWDECFRGMTLALGFVLFCMIVGGVIGWLINL